MSLHLSILRRPDLERPKGIHKRARTSSTELLEEEEDDGLVIMKKQGPPLNWDEVIVNHNSSLKDQMERLSKPSASFVSTDCTTLSEDEMASMQSLMEQTEGFESGFDTFDDFLNYSSSNLEEVEEEEASKIGDVKTKSKSKLKRKLKKIKAKLKTSLHVKKQIKRIRKNSGAILRAISNATCLVFRGVLFLTLNVLIVFTIILSLAMV